MKLFRILLEDSFRQLLFKLQQNLIDDLPHDSVVDIVNSQDGYVKVVCYDREYCVKPGDTAYKVFVLIKNGLEWGGPWPYDAIIAMMNNKDFSEGAYRAFICDNEWLKHNR